MDLVGYDCRNHPKDEESHEFGCNPETGFDCSGFVRYVLIRSGIYIADDIRHASEFLDKFGILVQRHRPGDLVSFSKEGRAPKHMGIMINDMEYVHSPGRNGTRVVLAELKRESISLKYPDQLYLENPIGFKTPTVQKGRWQGII